MKPISFRSVGWLLAVVPALGLLSPVAPGRALAQAVPSTQLSNMTNGAPLEVARNPAAPRDTVVAAFMGGAGRIPMDKQGVTQILFEVFRQGPEGMTQEEYKDRLFFAGGSISFSVGHRAAYVVVKAPPESLGAMLSLARDVMTKPKLDAKHFQEAKRKALTDAVAANDSMQRVASYFSTRDLFSYHPETLGGDGSPWSIGNVALKDARAAAQTLFPWESAFYVSTGPSEAERVKAAVEDGFWPSRKPAAWKPLAFKEPSHLKGAGKTPTAVIIDKPKATDNQVYFFFPLRLRHDSPEALDAAVAHEMLGGGLTGDLGRTLRVERGLTYGVNSFVGTRLPVWGVFTFGGLFQTQDLLSGVLEVVDKFRARTFTPEEIALARDTVRTDFQASFELPSDRVFERIRYRLYGLDAAFLETYLQELDKVTPGRVKAFVDTKVTREGGHLYVMGDAKKIRPILGKLGIPVKKVVSIPSIK
jgi:zinc protease